MAPKERWIVGALLAPLILPAIYLYLDLFVSGGTFYQGRREWGHVYKHLGGDIWLLQPSYLPILTGEVACVLVLKGLGRYSAPYILTVSTVICAIGGLSLGAFIALDAGRLGSPFSVLPIFGLSAAGAMSGAVLAAIFCLVAAPPWRLRDVSSAKRPGRVNQIAGIAQLSATLLMGCVAGGLAFLIVVCAFRGTIPVSASGFTLADGVMRPPSGAWMGFRIGDSRVQAVANGCLVVERRTAEPFSRDFEDPFDCARDRLGTPTTPSLDNEEYWWLRLPGQHHCLGLEPETLTVIVAHDRVKDLTVDCGAFPDTG